MFEGILRAALAPLAHVEYKYMDSAPDGV